MRLVLVCVVLWLAVSWASTAIGRPQPDPGDRPRGEDVIEIGDTYYMIYAGKEGKEWQTGLAKARKP